MSPDDLQTLPRTRLAQLARSHGVAGWSTLSRMELIAELRRPQLVDDRVSADLEDPHWLCVQWQISPATLDRVAATLGGRWRTAGPLLTVYLCGDLETSVPSRRKLQTLRIPRGTMRWHLQVEHPGDCYQVELGYGPDAEDCVPIAHSGLIRTHAPRNGNGNGSSNGDGSRVLHDPVRTPPSTPSGEKLALSVACEVLIHGQTLPGAEIRIDDQAVSVDPHGRFELRRPMDEGRMMLPVVATSSDGGEQCTIALVLEQHGRRLEPDRTRRPERHRRP